MKKIIIVGVIAFILLGIILSFQNEVIIDGSNLHFFSFKYFFLALLFFFAALFLSFTGINTFIIYFLFEMGLTGFFASYFVQNFAFNGFIFYLLYIILCKLVIWLFFLLLAFYAFKMQKNICKKIFRKSLNSSYNIQLYFKKMLIISILCLFYLFFLCLFSEKILIFFAKHLLF